MQRAASPTRMTIVACAFAAVGCTGQIGEPDPDPALTLGDEEWWDEGPPAGEESIDADVEEVP
ncbi:MAG TPA: hypothetical protein VIL20_19400, partial [Sandaracinaceae bacterium]